MVHSDDAASSVIVAIDVMETPPIGRTARIRPFLGSLALFSGAALALNILAEVSLPAALVATSLVVLLSLISVFRRSTPGERGLVAAVVLVGALAGIVATLAYDVAKAVLSQADPSPYDPFEAIRVFGILLIGPASSPVAVFAAGAAFHLLNGTCFGIAYTFLLGRMALHSLRRAVVSGMGWGLFLETFQLTLYPGWLDIRLYQEFATISALGHLVYGATLGVLVRTLIHRFIVNGRPTFGGPKHPEGGP